MPKLALPKRPRTKDYDLRAAITRRLLAEGIPRRDIRHEIPLDTASSMGRADMVLLLDKLIGIEIKSGSDTLDRLEDQMWSYRLSFDGTMIVVDRRLMSQRPGWFGGHLFTFDRDRRDDPFREGSGWMVKQLAPDFSRSWAWGASHHTSPRHMANLLWQREAAEGAGKLFGLSGRLTRVSMLRRLQEETPLKVVRGIVRDQLRGRPLSKWEAKFWTRYDSEQEAHGTQPVKHPTSRGGRGGRM